MSIVNLWNSRASSQIDNFRLHVDSDAPGEREKKMKFVARVRSSSSVSDS